MTTTCKHPIREGITYSDNFDVVGSHATDAWGRCKTCGAWWWSVIDEGKFQYEAEWLLPTDLAEAALLRHEPDALARLFVTMDLPHGPVWETGSAMVEIFCALTPGATQSTRARAIRDAKPKDQRWLEAARLLELQAKWKPPKKPLAFDFDVRVEGGELGESFEVGDALVVLSGKPQLFRVERAGIVQLPLAAPAKYIASRPDGLMVSVTDRGLVVMDGAGTATSWPLEGAYTVSDLDDGWWLFVPDTGETERFIELHAPDGRPKVKFKRRFAKDARYMPAPRKVAGGWIVSDLVDDEGKTQALTLFDEQWSTIAQSEGIDGQRDVTPIDAESFWASTDGKMERWARHGKTLDRAQVFAARSSWVVGDKLITDSTDGEVVGRASDGRQLWSWKRATTGATYGVSANGCVLVWDDTRAYWLSSDGKLKRSFEVESPDVDVGSAGTLYMKTGAELWILAEDARAIVVGLDAEVETACGDAVLLRNEDGNCTLVGKQGPIGAFEAPDACFSVVGTRGGPWVIEGDRIRGIFPR